MSDHCEEQEMEAEALAAIFDSAFEVLSASQPFEWSVKLLPVDCGEDDEEEQRQNHVGIILKAKIPLDYPEGSLPELRIEVIKGLTEEHRSSLLHMAQVEAANNEGMPAIYAICEVLREWLGDNNVKGLDDASMHAQMMRRNKEAERKEALKQQEFEAQKKEEGLSLTELEDLEVRKRRAEGTPCNKQNFLAWKAKFENEMAQRVELEEAEKEASAKKSKEKKEDKTGRLSGFDQFSGKAINMEAIEAAAEQAENDEIDPDELDVDEELFDVDDDDLDDLDFDDESDQDDDDEDEPDI